MKVLDAQSMDNDTLFGGFESPSFVVSKVIIRVRRYPRPPTDPVTSPRRNAERTPGQSPTDPTLVSVDVN